MNGFTAPEGINHYMYRSPEGTRLLDRDFPWKFWEILENQRLVSTLFYEGHPRCAADFTELVERPDQRFFFSFKGKQPLGLWWLNGFAPKSCWLHYCFFREAWGRDTIRTGRAVTDYLLNYPAARPDAGGGFYFDVIKGQTPARNPLAVRALKLMGFQTVGEMPSGAWCAAEDRSIPVIISCKTRKEDTQANSMALNNPEDTERENPLPAAA